MQFYFIWTSGQRHGFIPFDAACGCQPFWSLALLYDFVCSLFGARLQVELEALFLGSAFEMAFLRCRFKS